MNLICKILLRLIVASFVFLLPFTAHSKELITLLPKLINQHEQIKAAEANRNEALYLHDAARGRRLPVVDFSTDASREWVKKADDVKTTETSNFQNVKLSQLLTDFGATGAQISSSQISYDKTKVELETARQEVLIKGISAYLGVVRAREKLKYAVRSEENIKEQTGMEEILLEKKAGLSSDYLQTKAQLARARALRVSVEGELAVAKNRFRAVFVNALSDNELKSFNLPKLPTKKMPVTLDVAIARAQENNPKILADFYAVELTKINVVINKKGKYFPRVNAFAEAVRRENDLGVVGVRHEEIVGLELTYNLFNGGSDRAAIKAAA